MARPPSPSKGRQARIRSFHGVLQSEGTNPGWTVVRLPFDPVAVWPQRRGLRVRGTIRRASSAPRSEGPGGFEFRTSLFRAPDGVCLLPVNKRMQKGAALATGSLAEVTLAPDLELRPTPATPPELDRLLRRDRALRAWHTGLSPSRKQAIADLIAQPKSAEARMGRAELWAERMLLAMEGERTTPPILEAVFIRQPQAREGWRALTPIQRRNHLMGIFYYQSPESRQKRAMKAVEQALHVAKRLKG